MIDGQSFGGPWTETKLEILGAYIDAYTTALKNTNFDLVYVDAFAGSGSRTSKRSTMATLFELEDLEEVLQASPRLALDVSDRPFDRFLFVDSNWRNVQALKRLIAEKYPDRRDEITIERGDANDVVSDFCKTTNWRGTRAVMFFDPFGMQTDWSTIEAIAATRAIDLWYLVPTGMGLNRLLTKSQQMEKSWEACLDRHLGTPAWREHFYVEVPQADLFDAHRKTVERVYDDDHAEAFVLDRLRGVFAGGVASKAVRLRNTRGQTMFILTFACANPRAHQAIRIAEHLVRRWEESDRHYGRL
jgi:three-Cys-motif partner protein